MMVQQMSRRGFLLLSGVITAAAVRWKELLRGATPARRRSPSTPPTYDEGTPADLSVRWLHLEPRVSALGIWTNLIAGWLFDEGGGYAFTDVTGRGHTLSITGSDWNTSESGLLGAVHRAGFRGWAVALNGTRWLAAPPTTDLAVDQRGLSVTVWVRLEARPKTTATVIRLGSDVSVTVDPSGRASWSVTTTDGRRHVVRSADRLPLAWSHLAVAVDPSAGAMSIWVDGELSGHIEVGLMHLAAPSQITPELGRGVHGLLDQTTIHRGALNGAAVQQIRVLGLPRFFTQTSESIDGTGSVFTRYKGSQPIPHPVLGSSALSLQYAETLVSVQGDGPLNSIDATFVPSHFRSGWWATAHHAVYRSPLTGSGGTFEAWYEPIHDPADPHRGRDKIVFTATAASGRAKLVLLTRAARWQVEVTSPSGRTFTATGPTQLFPTRHLAHIAVAWGVLGGELGVRLLVDGYPVAFLVVPPGSTTYDGQLAIGGTSAAPAYVVFDDVRISTTPMVWGDVCPRGQVSTDAAGLDLRDFFVAPVGTAPRLWRHGLDGPNWTITRRSWQSPQQVGDDPDANLVVSQGDPTGLHSLHHPDAYGRASAIEAGLSVDTVTDGWAGVFLLSGGPATTFSGVAFMLNTGQNLLSIRWYVGGAIRDQRTVPYDFTLGAATIYEITLTAPGSTGDGVYRAFIDHTNVLSMLPVAGGPTEGYAGLVTDGAAASFSAVHFTALTPATALSRVIRIGRLQYGASAVVGSVDLIPFKWNKRRGVLPWNSTSKDPEPPGNIAGANTALPHRPIRPAYWRGEESANSDFIVVDGTVWCLLRGNPRIDHAPHEALIGMLHTPATRFDALHFTDPNQHNHRIHGGGALLAASPIQMPGIRVDLPNLNAPASAYAGSTTLVFLGRESPFPFNGGNDETAYARFNLATRRWETDEAQKAGWSDGAPGELRLHGDPETISLRRADSNTYHALVFQQYGPTGRAVMGSAFYVNLTEGVPQLEDGIPVRTSLSRQNGGDIYGFRVLFDNGIYYLHYNEGPQVPDWPQYFVLATAIDPYYGPWVRNEDTNRPDSSYFHRGTEFEPDNGAIWQGTMFKFRGHYYLYYENYHSIGDVNMPYGDYGRLQAGSRVGLATA